MLNDKALSVYRLGLWYGSYRLVVVISLFLIFLFSVTEFQQMYYEANFYFSLILIYLIVSLAQFLTLSFTENKNNTQVFLCGLIDITCFSILNFTLDQINIYIGLLFVVTIFIINLVLQSKVSITLTILAIITVIYPTFIQYWFNNYIEDNALLNSLALSVLFIIVCFVARVSIKYIERLEKINIIQSNELIRTQEINNIILDQIDTGYMVLDQDYNIIVINPAAKEILNIQNSDGNQLQKISTKMYQVLKEKLSLHKKMDFDFNDDGISIKISFQKIDLPEPHFLLGIEQLDKLNERVQYLKLASLGQLSASIAHEIRNPLASVVQANSLIIGSNPEKTQRFVDIISNQCCRIDKIIKSTLNMAKNKGFNPVLIDLTDFFNSLLREDVQDISGLIDLKIQKNNQVLFDEEQLRQVFINLIRNAVRHNISENSKQILIEAYQEKDQIFIDVIDYGTGVEQSKIQNLFHPFFSTDINGTGLGLYLCKNLCEANHGKVEYVKISKGACFRVKCRAN